MLATISIFGLTAKQVIGLAMTALFAGIFAFQEIRKRWANWQPAKPKTKADVPDTKPKSKNTPGPQHVTRGSDALPPNGAVDWVWDICARMKYKSGSVTADSVLAQLLQGATGRVASDARITELEEERQSDEPADVMEDTLQQVSDDLDRDEEARKEFDNEGP